MRERVKGAMARHPRECAILFTLEGPVVGSQETPRGFVNEISIRAECYRALSHFRVILLDHRHCEILVAEFRNAVVSGCGEQVLDRLHKLSVVFPFYHKRGFLLGLRGVFPVRCLPATRLVGGCGRVGALGVGALGAVAVGEGDAEVALRKLASLLKGALPRAG